MKNENIRKINTLGKVGKILAIIVSIASIIISGTLIVTGCLMFTVDNDFAAFDGNAVINLTVDKEQKIMDFGLDKLEKDEADIKLTIGNVDVNFDTTVTSQDNPDNSGYRDYSIDLGVGKITGHEIKIMIGVILIMCGSVTLCLAIAMIFAKRFCTALEKCGSPFEENVIKKLKAFAVSLIPWGALSFGVSGISSLGIVFIVVFVILFTAIFSYGAELQRESDETL